MSDTGLLRAHPGAFGPHKIPPLKGITASGTRMVCSVPEGGKPPARWRRDPDFPLPTRRTRTGKAKTAKHVVSIAGPQQTQPEVEAVYGPQKADGATFWPSHSDTPEPFERGQQLTHKNRGPCTFQGLDEMTRGGETSWVQWPDGTGGMVTTRLLSPAVPEPAAGQPDTDAAAIMSTDLRSPLAPPPVPAYELRNHPDRFVGQQVTVTSTSWGGKPGKTYTGELVEAVPVLPVGDKTYTGVRIKGVAGPIWVDNDSPVTIHDNSSTAPEQASE